MATKFFKNFNEAGRVTSDINRPYGEANIPSPVYWENKATWRDRLAIPFSYKNAGTQHRDGRQFGILYVPYYEYKKIKDNGLTNSEDIDIYGAELIDGPSLTTDGFRKLFNENKNNDFQIEGGDAPLPKADKNGNTAPWRNASGTFPNDGQVFGLPAAEKADTPGFIKRLREIFNIVQKGGGA